MVIFRENTEDIYAGKELQAGTPEAKKLLEFLRDSFDWDIREDSGLGIKPISKTGSKRLHAGPPSTTPSPRAASR